MRPLLATVAVAALCAPAPAFADHLNGEFFGIGPWAEYSLELYQDGETVEADILRCDELVVELDGASDGGDMARGQAYSVEEGSVGGFYLQWSPGAVMLVVDLDGMRYEAAFGAYPSPNGCGAATRGQPPDRWGTRDHAPEHQPADDFEDDEDDYDDADGDDDGSPFPNY